MSSDDEEKKISITSRVVNNEEQQEAELAEFSKKEEYPTTLFKCVLSDSGPKMTILTRGMDAESFKKVGVIFMQQLFDIIDTIEREEDSDES